MMMFLKSKWIGALKRVKPSNIFIDSYDLLLKYWKIDATDSEYIVFHKLCIQKLDDLEKNQISKFFEEFNM
jgi:hypothetical protein